MALNNDGVEAGATLTQSELIRILAEHRNVKPEKKESKPTRKSSKKDEDEAE